MTKGQAESSTHVQKTLVSKEAESVRSKVFLRLLSEYGNLWTKKFSGKDGDKLLKMANYEWALQLMPYSEAQVMAALTKWISGNKYTPKVSELIEIIKAGKPIEYFKKLPILQSSPEVAQAAIAAIRKKHGRPKVYTGTNSFADKA